MTHRQLPATHGFARISKHPQNGIAPVVWKGDDEAKVRSLIQSFLSTLHAKYPGIKDARYDFGAGQFLDRVGRPIQRESSRFDEAGGTGEGRAARAGQATLRRGIFLQSLVSGKSGEKSKLLEDALHGVRQLEDLSLDGLFASSLTDAPPFYSQLSRHIVAGWQRRRACAR